MTTLTRRVLAAGLSAALGLSGFIAAAIVPARAAVTTDPVDKVTICHRTHAVTNPYVLITVSVSSVISTPRNSNGHDTHNSDKQHDNRGAGTGPFPGIWDGVKNNTKFWGDIIPPFYYVDQGSTRGTVMQYKGLNWSPKWNAPTYEVQNNQKWITDRTFADAISYQSPNDNYDIAVQNCIDKATRSASAKSKAIDSAEALYALELKNGGNPRDVKQEIKDAAPVDPFGRSKWADPTSFSEVVPEPTVDKVTICHRTHAVTNPYRLITVSVSSVISTPRNSNGHDTHNSDKQHDNRGAGTGPFPGIYDGTNNNTKYWGDIIPPFTYLDGTTTKKFTGLNWSPNWSAPDFSIQNNQNWITDANFGAALNLAANDKFDKAVATCIGTDGKPAPQAKEIESAEKYYAEETKNGQKPNDVKDDIKNQGALDPKGNKQDSDPTNWTEPPQSGTSVDKVTICHRTASLTNPYVRITVSVDSVISTPRNSNGHDTHDSDKQHDNNGAGTGPFPGLYDGRNNNTKYWGDIIPPFWYLDGTAAKYYDGLNWGPNWKVPTYETQTGGGKWITDATFAAAIVNSSPLSKYDKAVVYCLGEPVEEITPTGDADPVNTTDPTLVCTVSGMKITGDLGTDTKWKWWYFQWSTQDSFLPTETSPKLTSPTGGTVSAQTGTLDPGTTYYFRIVGGHDVTTGATTAERIFWGNTEKCTTPGAAPTPTPTDDPGTDDYEGDEDPTPDPTDPSTQEPTTPPTPEPTPTYTTEPNKPITIDPKDDLTPPPGQEWKQCSIKLVDPATGAETTRVENDTVLMTVTDCKIVVTPKQLSAPMTLPTVIEVRLGTNKGQTVSTAISVRSSTKSSKIAMTVVNMTELPKTGASTQQQFTTGLLLLAVGLMLVPVAAFRRRSA